jgi:ATP-dependent exoDNAse (exonuclease V) alpha subunit
MLAVRRVDVTHLNDTTHARLLAAGRLGPHAVTARHGDQAREYRAGDRVMVTANDHRLGLLNGSRADVTEIDPRRQTLTLATEEHRQVTVGIEWAGRHLDHGYAMTCHKAQGATVDTALLYGAGALTRESGYVALSRGRTENHIYVPEAADVAAVRIEDGHLDQLAARLSFRHTQTLATRQLPRREADRWRLPSERDRSNRQAEGISR